MHVLYMDVAVLHFLLALIFDNQHSRFVIHGFVYGWCHAAAWLLGINSYLLTGTAGDATQALAAEAADVAANGDDGNADRNGDAQNHLQADRAAGPVLPGPAPAAPPQNEQGNQPPIFQRIHDLVLLEDMFRERDGFVRPSYFALRVCYFLRCV